VLLTSEAPLGRVALVRTNDPILPTQRVFALRGKLGVLDSRFLFYALQTELLQSQLLGRATGTTVVGIRQPALRSVKLTLPSIDGQLAIAEVLGVLDDKIAANQGLLSTLSDLTRVLFRQAVSGGVLRVRLGDLITVTKGVSYKSADLAGAIDGYAALVTLKSVGRDGEYSSRGLKPYIGPYKAAQIVRTGEIVVAQTDLTQGAEVVGRAVRVPRTADFQTLVASLDLAIVRPRPEVLSEFVLGLTQERRFHEHCRSLTSGTTVLHLVSGAIESYQAPVLSMDAQQEYAEAVRPLTALQDRLSDETVTLAALRDTLIPQLMSGRLHVRDAEKQVEAVV
jgi:type I restriction enzyme S subunit